MSTAARNGTIRKSLAEQLDRLDQTLDGLADNLNLAVATAVREGVQSVLAELLTSPEIANLIRSLSAEGQSETAHTGVHEEDEGSPPHRPSFFARVWSKTCQAIRSVGSGIGVGTLFLVSGGQHLARKTWSGLTWLWGKTKGLASGAAALVTRPLIAAWSAIRDALVGRTAAPWTA